MMNTVSKGFLAVFIFASILFVGCSKESKSQEKTASDAPVLEEAFQTDRDQGENVDSPAVWHGKDGQHWLLATAKEGDAVIVYDATDGSFIKRVGESGSQSGELQRPNGIWVVDNLMLVVERDNRRVQVFRLPDFHSMGTISHEDLRLPYGITADRTAEDMYEFFITDNYNPALEGYPAQGELDERIHQFQFTVQGDSLEAEHIRTFGEIRGEGVLNKVESLHLDREHNRLLIADEAFNQRNIKVYDLEGNFTGDVIPNTYFDSEPEGIALYRCKDGAGYWITTDQHETNANKFEVFDRVTLDHIGTFKGKTTRNTDGVWLTQKSFGLFEEGAFYPVHDDGSMTVIPWSDIANGLSLKKTCSK